MPALVDHWEPRLISSAKPTAGCTRRIIILESFAHGGESLLMPGLISSIKGIREERRFINGDFPEVDLPGLDQGQIAQAALDHTVHCDLAFGGVLIRVEPMITRRRCRWWERS